MLADLRPHRGVEKQGKHDGSTQLAHQAQQDRRSIMNKNRLVVAVVPAHNEEASIAATIQSLKMQSHPIDRIVIACDNCTDQTQAIATREGVLAYATEDNTVKKAGALNQILIPLLGGMADDDLVLIMDADSYLDVDFIANAIPIVVSRGAVSGAYVAATINGLVPFLQRVEYAQERFKISRKKARVNVLSGAAAMFTVSSLKSVASSRSKKLPGIKGQFYDESSLTEDFEITLALRRLGVECFSPKELQVTTDVMRNWRSLYGQRIRWQRGYLESLYAYPLSLTYKAWAVQLAVYVLSMTPILMVVVIGLNWYTNGVRLTPIWLLVIPIFVLSEAKAAKASGHRGQLLAASILPLAFYNVFRGFVYWRALGYALHARPSMWT